ncbi:hypothetical protein LJR066_006692 [Acidovorax sp. LjRoot66]|uniref:hypothetical protein n=1 Tax=Acidovorax sp. LjRoot66 TaxID=3342334 RepID=UPI003ECDB4CC
MKIELTPRHRTALQSLFDSKGQEPFRRTDLMPLVYPMTSPRSRDRANDIADLLIQEAAKAGTVARHGHLHWVKLSAERKLLSGRQVAELADNVNLTLTTKCPTKWMAVDLESGEIWTGTNDGSWTRASSDLRAEVAAAAKGKRGA